MSALQTNSVLQGGKDKTVRRISSSGLVMDHIESESLSDLLKRRGSLPEKEAVAIILEVASALDYMHKQNRYHLDVKPANIMLHKDGNVVLLDSRSSKQYAEVEGENTSTYTPCYTTGYAPAEQMNPKPTTFTAATDIYALGATLYKMLTGVTPPSAIHLLNGEETLQALPNKISKNVRECIEKAMIQQRSKRMQSVDEFSEILKNTVVADDESTVSEKQNEKKDVYVCFIILITSFLGIIASMCYPHPNDSFRMWYYVGGFIFFTIIVDLSIWYEFNENHRKQWFIGTLIVEAIMILTLALTYFLCRPNA